MRTKYACFVVQNKEAVSGGLDSMLDTVLWFEWYSVDVGVSTVEYGPGSGGEDSDVAWWIAPPPTPTGLFGTEL